MLLRIAAHDLAQGFQAGVFGGEVVELVTVSSLAFESAECVDSPADHHLDLVPRPMHALAFLE